MKYINMEEFNTDDEFHCLLSNLSTEFGLKNFIGIVIGERREYKGLLNGLAILCVDEELCSRHFTVTFVEDQYVLKFLGKKTPKHSDYFNREHGTLPKTFLTAIQAWADHHGRRWKEALQLAWETSNYQGFEYGSRLQQVRNQFGPAWLKNFKLEDFRG